jgi:hypothetical protein
MAWTRKTLRFIGSYETLFVCVCVCARARARKRRVLITAVKDNVQEMHYVCWSLFVVTSGLWGSSLLSTCCAWGIWRATGPNWTHRHIGILLMYAVHVATLVRGGGGIVLIWHAVGNDAEINTGYGQDDRTELVAPQTPLCHGLPQAVPVYRQDLIKLWAPVSPLCRFFPQAAHVNSLNQ